MKKISLFSRIIFILQAFVVLYPIVWIPIRILKIEVDILLPIIMYGIYLAIPGAVIGVLLCLVLLVKQRTDKKKVFKNPLHVSKLDIWMLIGVIMAIEIVACIFCKRDCILAITCATMMYYSFMEIGSFCVNQSMSGNKLINLVQKIANIFIKAFDIAIDTVTEKAESIASEDVEGIVERIIDSKLKGLMKENKG